MSRLQRSMLQLLVSAVLLVLVYIVATPTDVPRSALLQPSAVVDSAAPKWLTQKEYRTAQLLLAQLDSGRHQQKQRSQEQLVRSSLAGVPSSSRAMRIQGLAAEKPPAAIAGPPIPPAAIAPGWWHQGQQESSPGDRQGHHD